MIRSVVNGLALALMCPAMASAAGVSSHAMTVSGEAHNAAGGFSCATSRPQAKEAAFFNQGIGLPTEGYAFCGLAGGIDNHASSTAALSSEATTLALNGGTSTVSAASIASFTKLGVKSDGAFTGVTDSLSYTTAEASAYSSDVIPLPGFGAGSIQLGFSIDGNANSVGNSQTFVLLNYELAGGPSIGAFHAFTSYGTADVTFPAAGGMVPGFTTSGASLTGSTVAPTFLTPVTLGTGIELDLGLYASSYPGAAVGIANNDFSETARLTSILLLDASNNPITFSVTGASGTIYDNNGAHAPSAVPEPASWSLMIVGFALIGGSGRRSRAVRLGNSAR